MQNNTFKYLSNKQLEKNYTRSKRKKNLKLNVSISLKFNFILLKLKRSYGSPL